MTRTGLSLPAYEPVVGLSGEGKGAVTQGKTKCARQVQSEFTLRTNITNNAKFQRS